MQAGIIVGLDGDDPTVFQRTLRFLQQAHINALQLAILTPQPGTPLYDEFERAGRITDRDWSHYDFRHAVIRPARMTAQQLQDGADWLYRQFYRLDRIILRTIRAAFTVGLMPAYLSWRLNMTYRYDNRREGIVGRNPAAAAGRILPVLSWRRRAVRLLQSLPFLGGRRAGASCDVLRRPSTQCTPKSRTANHIERPAICAAAVAEQPCRCQPDAAPAQDEQEKHFPPQALPRSACIASLVAV